VEGAYVLVIKVAGDFLWQGPYVESRRGSLMTHYRIGRFGNPGHASVRI